MGPNPMIGVLIKKKATWTQRYTRRTPCEDRGKYSCKPKNAKGHHQSSEAPTGTNLADTLILNF